MSKQRPSAAPNEVAVPVVPHVSVLMAVLATAMVIGYVLLFFAGDRSPDGWAERRRVPLPLFFAPDQLLLYWVDGDWSRFAVLDHFPVLGAALIILAICYLTGQLGLVCLRVNRLLDPLENIVFATAAGLNLWSLFTLAVGLCGALRQRWVFGVAALLVVVASVHWRSSWSWRAAAAKPVSQDALNGLARLGIWLSVPFAVLIVWGSLLPPTYFDVREYHLQIPKEWFLQGRVTFVPHNVYGNMPLGAEMHAILGMLLFPGSDSWWWGSLAGKAVIGIQGPLAAMGLFAFGRRFVSATAGAVAALVYIAMPWIAHVSMNGLIDGSSALYALLALYAALLREAPPPQEPAPALHKKGDWTPTSCHVDRNAHFEGSSPLFCASASWVALSGFLAGGGVACKYPAIVFLVAPLLLFISLLQLRRLDLRAAIIFLAAMLAGCGLWLGKNWVLSGNPTYPLLSRWFDSKSWTDEQEQRWERAHGPPSGFTGASYSLAHLIATVKLIGLTSDGLSPALWPLVALACLARQNRRLLLILGAFLFWTAMTWWVLTHRIDRFLVPALPWACILAGAGAAWQEARWGRVLVAALLVVSSITSFLFDATLASDSRLLVSLNKLRQEIHPSHRYLNENVQPGYRALLVGEAQVWDLSVPVLYNTCFDDCMLEQLMKGRTRDERLAALREQRVSHVLVSWHELDRYRAPGNYGFSDFTTRLLVREELVKQQNLLRRIESEIDPDNSEVFEVVGWRDWE